MGKSDRGPNFAGCTDEQEDRYVLKRTTARRGLRMRCLCRCRSWLVPSTSPLRPVGLRAPCRERVTRVPAPLRGPPPDRAFETDRQTDRQRELCMDDDFLGPRARTHPCHPYTRSAPGSATLHPVADMIYGTSSWRVRAGNPRRFAERERRAYGRG